MYMHAFTNVDLTFFSDFTPVNDSRPCKIEKKEHYDYCYLYVITRNCEKEIYFLVSQQVLQKHCFYKYTLHKRITANRQFVCTFVDKNNGGK